VCGGSPLFCLMMFRLVICIVSCRGDYTGWEYEFLTLVLPSVFCVFGFVFSFEFHVGENTQGRDRLLTLVLPSLNRLMCLIVLSVLLTCRGDSQERRN